MTAAITFLAFIAIAGFLFMRMVRARDASPDYEPAARRPRRVSSKERKLERMREFEAAIPPRPTIQELMQQEVEATGIDRVPGGDGLEIPVRLRVWHRDADVRADCAAEGLRFIVAEGVERASASEDDVMLVCDGGVVPDGTAEAGSTPDTAE